MVQIFGCHEYLPSGVVEKIEGCKTTTHIVSKHNILFFLFFLSFLSFLSFLQMSYPEPEVRITYFNDATWAEFLESPRTTLGHRCRVRAPAGTIVVMYNLTTNTVVGVCVLRSWEGSDSPCREHHCLDPDMYKTRPEYNKFELSISDVRILTNPIPYADIRILVGGCVTDRLTNMWKNTACNYSSPFTKGEDQTPVQRYIIWAKSLV